MRLFLASIALGGLVIFSAALFKTEVQAQAKQPGIVVTAHREVAKPAPKHIGPTAAQLEAAIEAAEQLDTSPVQATPVAKAAPVKAAAKKCCPDCICQGECQCAYPGHCLIKSATPKHCRIEITQCYGDHCETRTYEPQMEEVATGKLVKVRPNGVWQLGKAPGVRGWSKRIFRAATAPVRAVSNAVQSGACQSCDAGGCSSCQGIIERRGLFGWRR